MPGAILWRWSEGRQRIFHGVLFSLRRMVPQEMWKYSCRHLSWRKKSCCMEMLKMLIKAETYQIERFFEVTIHWWVIGTLRTKNVSFKSHTYMKSFFGQFWNEKKNFFFLQKVRRRMPTVEFISETVTDTAARNSLKKSSTIVRSKDFSKIFETK